MEARVDTGASHLVRRVSSPVGEVPGAGLDRAARVSSQSDVARAGELHSTRRSPLPEPEPGALRKLGSWIADTAVGSFVSAAAGQLAEVLQSAWRGVRHVAAGAVEFAVNASVLVVGGGLSALQTAFGLEPIGRPVNDRERAMLSKVFGEGLDQSKLVLKEGAAGIASLTPHPFALGNTLYLKDHTLAPDATPAQERQYLALLVHEAVHAWQHQRGNTPIAASLLERVAGGAYDWRAGFAADRGFHELGVEQQAQFIQDAVRAGAFDSPKTGFRIGGIDYTCHLEQALRELRRAE